MKKIALAIVVIASILAPSFSKAVSYRGFVDGSFGVGFSKYDDTAVFTVDASTTHGLQISKNFFVGLGVIYRYSTDFYLKNDSEFEFNSNNYLRPNLCIKWDGFGLFKKSSRVSPFVDLKIGYSLLLFPSKSYVNLDGKYSDGVNTYYYYYGGYYDEQDKIEYDLNGWFFRPTVGIRIGCSSKVGINLGLFCDVSRLVKIKESNFVGSGSYYDYERGLYRSSDIPVHIKSQSVMWCPFGLTLGVDF